MCETGVLSCTGKLARVVLDNRGPLTPSEIAAEANISVPEAQEAIDDLVSAGFVEPICGIRGRREEVYTLTEVGENYEYEAE